MIDCLEATALSSAHSISGARLRWEVLIVVKYPACFPSQLIPKLFHVNCLSSIFYEVAVISCNLRQMGLFATTLAEPNNFECVDLSNIRFKMWLIVIILP